MSRKSRLAKKIQKQEERNAKNWKKQKYTQMKENGELGSKETSKYWNILTELSCSNCPADRLNEFYSVQRPTRNVYNQVRNLARDYVFN